MRSQSVWATCGLLGGLAWLKPLNTDAAFLAAFAYQIYVPGWVSQIESPWELLRPAALRSVKLALWVAAIVFPIYAGAFYALQTVWATRSGYQVFFSSAGFSGSLLGSFLIQLMVVALPEEYFYRGFLQRIWGSWRGIVVINAAFALGHFVGDYDPVRLLPFFPGLLFAWLYQRSQGLLGVTLFHALCNSFSEWLTASFHWSST